MSTQIQRITLLAFSSFLKYFFKTFTAKFDKIDGIISSIKKLKLSGRSQESNNTLGKTTTINASLKRAQEKMLHPIWTNFGRNSTEIANPVFSFKHISSSTFFLVRRRSNRKLFPINSPKTKRNNFSSLKMPFAQLKQN